MFKPKRIPALLQLLLSHTRQGSFVVPVRRAVATSAFLVFVLLLLPLFFSTSVYTRAQHTGSATHANVTASTTVSPSSHTTKPTNQSSVRTFPSLSRLLSVFAPQTASALASDNLNFQARLQTASGAIVPDGYYNIQFNLYSASSGGSSLWTETYAYNSGSGTCTGPVGTNDCRVRVANGYVSVYLGSQTAFPGTMPWDQQLFLTMNIGGTTDTGSITYDGEMTPRLKLTAVPYAMRASAANQLQTSSGANNATLSIAAPTSGNQTFVIQDQGAAGTYNILTALSGTDGYVKLQTSTPGTQQTGNLNISGAGIVGGVLQGGTLKAGSTQQFQVDASGNVTTSGSVSTGSGSLLTVGGATLNNTLSIGDLPTGGNIGTAAATVDIYTNFVVAQTTAGQTLTIPAPTTATTGRLIYITNVGSAGYTIGGSVASPGTTMAFVWNSITSAWTLISSGTTGAYIQNGTALQTANFNIQSYSTTSVTATIQGANSQSANILEVKAAGVGTPLFSVGPTAISLGEDAVLAGGKSLTLTGGNTASRPASPTEGMLYYDTDTHQLLVYNGNAWSTSGKEAVLVAASNSSYTDKAAADYVADGNTGAANDGDQVQINQALAAADPAGSGRKSGKVYLFAGTYTIDDSVSIPNNTTLAGAGAGTVITVPNSFDTTINAVTNTDTSTGTGVVIQDLRLEGNKANQSAGTMNGISFTSMGSGTGSSAVQGGKISNVWVNNWNNNGIILYPGSNNSLIGTVTQGNAFAGIYLQSSSNNTLNANIAQGNDTAGIYISSSSSNTLTGNTAQGNGGYGGIYMTSGSGNVLTGNTLDGNTNYGITGILGSSNSIVGNTVRHNTTGGIRVGFTSDNVISANAIYDNGGTTDNNGISVGDSDNNTITGNNITDSSATVSNYAIDISNSNSDANYLANNALGAGSIHDLGTGTIYGGQVDSSTNYVIQPAGTVELMKNTNVTGTLSASTSVLTPTLDTIAAGTLSIGDATATTVNIATNAAAHTINIGTGAGAQAVTIGSNNTTSGTTIQAGDGGLNLNSYGAGFIYANVSGTQKLRITTSQILASSDDYGFRDGAGDALLSLEAATGKVQVPYNRILDVVGSATFAKGLSIDGLGASNAGLTYTTPLGATLGTVIKVPNYNMPAFGTIFSFGISNCTNPADLTPTCSASGYTPSSARGILVADARNTAHQATIGILSPDENQIGGLSYDGSNTTLGLVNTADSITLKGNGVNLLTTTKSGTDALTTLGVAGTNAGKLILTTATNSNTVTLQSATQTGNYTLTIPDLTANSTILTDITGIQLQATTPGTAQTGNFNISGTGIAATFQATNLVGTTLDTATGVALNIGASTPTTTQINLNQDTVVATGKNFTVTNGTTALTGTVNINTSGAATTSIGTGTGNNGVGNTTGTLGLTGATVSVLGTTSINTTGTLATTIGSNTAGAVSITSNAASNFTTNSGALTLTSAAAATWGTNAGLLTLQGAGGTTVTSTAGTSSSDVTISTGNASAGAAGNISIDTGTFTSGTPTISIGTGNAAAVTIGKTTTTVTIQGNLVAGASAGTGTFTNNGATINTEKTYGNLATGAMDTAANSVDKYTYFSIAQTTAGRTITLPTPTTNPTTVFGRIIHVSNIGTASFTIGGSLILPGNTATFIWSNTNGGQTWQYTGDGGGSANYIQNTTTLQGSSNFYISGIGKTDTAFTTPAIRAATDSTTAIKIQNAAGSTDVVTVDTSNSRVGIGTTTAPATTLHVSVSNATTTTPEVRIEQTGAGDASVEFKTPAQSYYLGVDTSATSHFKLSSGTATGASGTVGYETVGTSTDTSDAGTINFTKFTAPTTGTIYTLYAYVDVVGSSPNNKAQMAVYSDSAGFPNTTLGNSSETTLTANAWNSFTVAGGISVTAGQVIWLGYNANGPAGTNNNLRYNANGSAGQVQYKAVTYNSWPSPIGGWSGNAAWQFSVYALITGTSADNFGVSLLSIGRTGDTVFQNSVNNTAAFQVQNAAGTGILNVDTTNGHVGINLAATETAAFDLALGGAANRFIGVNQNTSAGAGRTLTIQGGQGNAGIGGVLALVGGAGNGSGFAGGALTLAGGVAGTGNAAGGAVQLNGGAGSGTQAGGAIQLTGGTGGATGAGGALTLTGGTGGATSGVGGAVSLVGGTARGAFAGGLATLQGGAAATATAGSNGGGVAITAAAGGATGTGGNGGGITLTAGNATGTGVRAAGSISLTAGASSATGTGASTAGTISLQGGTSNTANIAGGLISITGGTGNGTAAGGVINITGGTGGGTNGTGGAVTIKGGTGGATNANGGTLNLAGGDSSGTGYKGLVSLSTTAFDSSATISFGTSNTLNSFLANAVNNYSSIRASASAINLTLTVDAPNVATVGRILYLSNSGTNDFTILLSGTSISINLKANSTATLLWNGNGWTAAGASSATDLQAAYNNTQTGAGGAEIVLKSTADTPAGTGGLTIRDNPTLSVSGALLEVQSAIGTNMFAVNNNTTEYAVNGGAENSTFTGWALGNGVTPTKNTTAPYYATGTASVAATVTATTQSIKNTLSTTLPFNNSARAPYNGQYMVSFTARSTSAFNLDVFYSSNGTNTVTSQCVSTLTAGYTAVNNWTLVGNTYPYWTKITCIVTVPASGQTAANAIFIRNTNLTSGTFYVDNLSVTSNAATNTPANVQIGGGLYGGQPTLLTLDSFSAAPMTNLDSTYIGSMYYDTTSGSIQCYQTSNTWGSCGSAPDDIITLTPEYTNAVLNGTGVGTMTADFCGNGGGLSVNTGFCASGEARNYYKWSSPQPSTQSYSIFVAYKLPSTFKNFYNGTTTLTGLVDNTSNASVNYSIYRKASGGGLTNCSASKTVVGWNGASAVGSANTWTTAAPTTDPSTCTTFAAGDTAIFQITVSAQGGYSAYAENLTFRFTNK